MPKIRIQEMNGVALLLFTVCVLAGLAISQETRQPAYAISGALVGLYFLFAIKVVRQWEKVAVLRLGRYVGLRGPGLCHIVPIVAQLRPIHRNRDLRRFARCAQLLARPVLAGRGDHARFERHVPHARRGIGGQGFRAERFAIQ